MQIWQKAEFEQFFVEDVCNFADLRISAAHEFGSRIAEMTKISRVHKKIRLLLTMKLENVSLPAWKTTKSQLG